MIALKTYKLVFLVVLLPLLLHLLPGARPPPGGSGLLLLLLLLLLVVLLLAPRPPDLPAALLLALPPGVAAAAVPLEAAQELGAEPAEGAGVAARPVRLPHVLLQAAGQEEAPPTLLAGVRALHLVGAQHVADGKACGGT